MKYSRCEGVIVSDSEVVEMDTSCGFSIFTPKWLHKFATIKCFMAVYGVLGMLQAMAFIYLTTTITTMEKVFKIPSKTTGFLLTGNEMSQILLSLVLSYQGAHRNRPRWIAWGAAITALSFFVVALPHFLFGASEEALALTKHYWNESAPLNNLSNSKNQHSDYAALCNLESPAEKCEENAGSQSLRDYTYIALFIIFASQFILGIGNTLFYALGQAYLDDNTKKSRTPVLLAWTFTLRTVGPAFGFILTYLCLRVYVIPSEEPVIDSDDPRWLGAWWLGWIILGFMMMILAVLVAMFPRNLPVVEKNNRLPEEESLANGEYKWGPENEEDTSAAIATANNENKYQTNYKSEEKPTFKGFKVALRRLLSNKLLMCNNFAGIFYILGSLGYIIYITRYIEVQFQKTATSTVIIGPITLIGMIAGLIISGYVITKYKPRPVYLLGWNVMCGAVYIIGEFLYIQLSCDDIKEIHSYPGVTGSLQLMSSCNQNCSCFNVNFSPVCEAISGTTFYSPCHAGCTSSDILNGTKMYTDCSCLNDYAVFDDGIVSLNDGPCFANCEHEFFVFIAISFVINVIGSSGRIGNLLVNYRSVDIKDKALAQGLTLWMISLLALIPGPILYGDIIDSTCLIWNEACGKRGNCWLYDRRQMRVYLNSTAMIFTTLAILCDAMVCYLGRNLNLYDELPQSLLANNKSKSLDSKDNCNIKLNGISNKNM